MLIAALVAMLAAVFASTQVVFTNKHFIWLKSWLSASFLEDPRLVALLVLCLILLAITLKSLLNIFQQWQMVAFSESAAKTARKHLFSLFLRAPYLWILKTGTTDLLFVLGSSGRIGATLLTSLQIISNTLVIIALGVSLFAVATVPAILFLLLLGGLGTLILKVMRRIVSLTSNRVYHADRSIHALQQMAVHGLTELRIYGREATVLAAYGEKLEEGKKARQSQAAAIKLPVGSLEIMTFLTLIGVMCYLVFIQEASMVRISGIMGFMAAAAWRALPATTRLVENITTLRTSLPFMDNVAKFIAVQKELQAEMLPPFEERQNSMPFEHEIVLQDIAFKYPGVADDCLSDLSLHINKGDMVGLVGTSGAGKSTLVNILTGLVQVSKGVVTIDGQPLTRENASAWLNKIGYVAQSPYILNASLAENVALSRWGEELDRDRVLACCKMASVDFLNELEDGIDTTLGNKGTRLSGGEAQRVAIARALYSNPDLIIFDEATSALDLRNEQAVHNTILSLQNKVTMVIIAHRLSTVEKCDYLVWLDKGKVKMQGQVNEVLPAYEIFLKEHGIPHNKGE